MKVIRDAGGKLINIGDWDYLASVDDDGFEVIHNPMPVGAVESDEEVVEGLDGGLYVAGDPRADG